MTEELVGAERRGGVCVLMFRRPDKLNALSTAVEVALGHALVSEELRTSRAVVIAGEGRAFSAGADVTEFRDATPASILAYYRDTGDVYERFAALPQPTVAAIHGWCVGGGLELALAADFRVADESAVFRLPEVAIGIIPSSGGTHRLVRMPLWHRHPTRRTPWRLSSPVSSRAAAAARPDPRRRSPRPRRLSCR